MRYSSHLDNPQLPKGMVGEMSDTLASETRSASYFAMLTMTTLSAG